MIRSHVFFVWLLLLVTFIPTSHAQQSTLQSRDDVHRYAQNIWQYLCSQTKQTDLEKKFFELVFWLDQQNSLPIVIESFIDIAVDQKIIAEDHELIVSGALNEMVTLHLKAELVSRGYDKRFYPFMPWMQIEKNFNDQLANLGLVPSFKSQRFLRILSVLSRGAISSTNRIVFLNDAQQSLNTRLKLINKAVSEISMMVWGYHDDEAGQLIANALINAHNHGVKVKLIVDGLTSMRPGYQDYLATMESAGIEIMRWRGLGLNPFFGMHAKVLVVDGEYVIEGGRNVGDKYLFNNKWRDQDIFYADSRMARQVYNEFVRIWNLQNEWGKEPYGYLQEKSIPHHGQKGFIHTAHIWHYPNVKGDDPIYLLTLFALRNARYAVDIDNAYYIETPTIRNEIINAARRGVRVRIHTNSHLSVDEEVLSIPMLRSLRNLQSHGVEIYLKQGETLHTKAFRADDMVWVGSYNFHPRSHYYEVEKITVMIGDEVIGNFLDNFESQLADAVLVQSTEQLQSGLSPHIENLIFRVITPFYNQL